MIDEQERRRKILLLMKEADISEPHATSIVDIGLGLSNGDVHVIDLDELDKERQRVADYLGMKSSKPPE